MRYFIFALLAMVLSGPVAAAVHEETIDYKDGETLLEGYLAYADQAPEGKRPGVIVIHDWMGPSEYTKFRVQELAKLGYVAFAVDIYGKDTRPKDTKEASAAAAFYKNDRSLMRRRAQAGIELLRSNPLVDPEKIAVIGYCFGGTAALEVARSGQDVAGVVSFHGGLATSSPAQGNVKAKVLVLHGADDPYVPLEEVQAFQKEMNESKADWQMVYYSGAVHSFTRKDAGNDNSKGAAYNPKADQRSWNDMKQFFAEIF